MSSSSLLRKSHIAEEHSVGATKVTVSPETASWRQLPNGCSDIYTLFLVDTKIFNDFRKYIK
jgi:hypothetical protein